MYELKKQMKMTKITKEKLLEQGFVEGQYENIPIFSKHEKVLAYNNGLWVLSRFLNGSLIQGNLCVSFMEELESVMKR